MQDDHGQRLCFVCKEYDDDSSDSPDIDNDDASDAACYLTGNPGHGSSASEADVEAGQFLDRKNSGDSEGVPMIPPA